MMQITVQQSMFEGPTIHFQLFDHIVKAPVNDKEPAKIKERLFIDQTFLIYRTMLFGRINAYKNGSYIKPLSDAKLRAISILKGVVEEIERDHYITLEKYFKKIQNSFQYFDFLTPTPESRFYNNFTAKYLTMKELFFDYEKTLFLLA